MPDTTAIASVWALVVFLERYVLRRSSFVNLLVTGADVAYNLQKYKNIGLIQNLCDFLGCGDG